MALALCTQKTLLFFFIISGISVAYIISLQLAKPNTHVYQYHSSGLFRECARWDDSSHRFIISLGEGGIGQVSVPDDYSPGTVLEEGTLVKDVDLAGNSSIGMVIDRPRNRLLVAVTAVSPRNRLLAAVTAVSSKKPNYCALAAYNLSTWKRLFLTQLNGPSETNSFADDVAVDAEGNAYVTDVLGNKIWKVDVDGKFQAILESPLFTPKEWYKHWIGLNGIVYHPDGFLIVLHYLSGNLFKIDIGRGDEVKLIELVGSKLTFGDGMALLSPTKLVVAGIPTAQLVESSDGWKTASVVGKFSSPVHRLPTAVAVKDGRVYINQVIGLGYPKKKHVLVEAIF